MLDHTTAPGPYVLYIGTKHSAAWRRYNGKVYASRYAARRAMRRIARNPIYWNYGVLAAIAVTEDDTEC